MLNSSFFLSFPWCSWNFLWTASLFGFSWLAVLLYFQGFTFRGRKYMSLQTFPNSFFYRHLIQMTGKPSSNSRQNWNAKVEQMFGPLLPGSSIKHMVIESYYEMKEGNENINITSDCDFFFLHFFPPVSFILVELLPWEQSGSDTDTALSWSRKAALWCIDLPSFLPHGGIIRG